MNIRVLLAGGLLLMAVIGSSAALPEQVRVEGGIVQGIPRGDSAVRIFKGIPFAAPPWATCAGSHRNRFRSGAVYASPPSLGSTACRTTSMAIWCSATKARAKIAYTSTFGHPPSPRRTAYLCWSTLCGGFAAGAASEARYDGENLAKKGVIVVNMNYRLSTFGFFSHPELTKESAHKASGNYGLMDQVAALDWVRKNIKALGGDPNKVTIGGESAGSFSVSAIMASPLSKRLIHGAIGESGAFFTSGKGTLAASPLAVSQQAGLEFAKQLGADSIAARGRSRPKRS